jgi:prepilin peptidase dependent protein B
MKKQKGYSLIEIIIALIIGLIILTATISIYISTIKGSSDIVKSARLNHDLNSALALMVNDIRRSGYWGGATVGSDSRNNPFTQAATDLQFPSPACVLYTYDADADGIVDADEYYGFKLNGTNIQMRLSGSSTNNCNLNTDVWNTLNISEGNEQIDITNLTFTQSFKCLRKRVGLTDQSYDIADVSTCATAAINAGDPLVTGDRVIITREITIALAGRLFIDQAVTKNLMDRIKIRNDRVFTQP